MEGLPLKREVPPQWLHGSEPSLASRGGFRSEGEEIKKEQERNQRHRSQPVEEVQITAEQGVG